MVKILVHIYNSSPKNLTSLSQTCTQLALLIRSVRCEADVALPASLSKQAQVPPGLAAQNKGANLTLLKTRTPGDAVVVFRRDISSVCAYWQFRIDVFKGHRIDIGVATRDSFRFGSVERATSWSFDCFGRVTLAGRRKTYGRQMRSGDIVGMLYDFSRQSISFLDNGISMGELKIRDARWCGRKALFPFVYFPYHEGEKVTLLGEKPQPLSVQAVHHSFQLWKRPSGLPYDGRIIVQTWEERKWYAMDLDCNTTSLAVLWSIVQEKHDLSMNLFELICNGVRLENTDTKTLRDVGIIVDRKTGTYANDILLTVPHIAS